MSLLTPAQTENARAVAHEALATLPTAPAGTTDAFFHNATDTILRNVRFPDSRVFCFVLCIDAREIESLKATHGGTFLAHLQVDDTLDLECGVYFALENLSKVLRVETPSNVQDALALVGAAARSASPALLFQSSSRRVTLFYSGVVADALSFRLSDRLTAPLSDDALDKMLCEFHRDVVASPSSYAEMWSDAGNYVPMPKAELIITKWLYYFLAKTQLSPGRVRMQVETSFGKIDILVDCGQREELSHYYCCLELKVLRSKTSSGNLVTNYSNARELLKGLRQTMAYVGALPANEGVIAAYDARSTHTDLEPFRARAKRNAVRFLQFPLFNTTEAARAALVSVAD